MAKAVLAKTVVLVIASSGFQEQEYLKTRDALVAAGISVITASDTSGVAIASDNKTQVTVDETVGQVKVADVDGLFLIGGPGALDCLDTPTVQALVKSFAAAGKPYGAICISPRILAEIGLLTGKKATGWNADGELPAIFKANGVDAHISESVVIDGMVVTANGPKAATAFGQAIAGVIQNAS